MLERLHFETREEWLDARDAQGIGGSEAAAVVGMSPWMTATELWRVKLGIGKRKDLSGNEAVARGVHMEGYLRAFFCGLHPEFALAHYPYDMLFQTERPWLFATLDGELKRSGGGDGILEIKTGTTQKWQEWKDGAIPRQYYIQVLHQLLATGWDFAIVFGLLYRQNGDMELLEREVWREDCQSDLKWLAEKEEKFWRHIENGTMPPQIITL